MAKDPICSMDVGEQHGAGTSEYHGKTYYCCGIGCKEAFARNPQQYASGQSAGGHH